ncbi:ATP-grasp domain-containing protein [Aquibacillus salsiterrae]|uniref:ATP-grasp domain-containing protein n=1 Tax=Aquibacillus salsiterrae TaxID=2950439 RepID=A0A9X3WB46_9BACI|nr:ATP-grasp domain-containing protein [Aquibacillus salsiterrae]MDC3416210.1 ATP-grasp domain-containing protein [Aquibacillus salsiterrae]
MAIAILNRLPINIVNFKEWLEECEETFYILLPENKKSEFQKEGYTNIVALNNYYNDSEMMISLKKIHKTDSVNLIIAIDEVDIERAAMFREYFGITDGQKLFSATSFRNKFWMKEVIKSSNIPVPAYEKIQTIDQAKKFAKQYSYPVVVKPNNGMGSIGVQKVNSDEELEGIDLNKVELIEQFIEIENMYSVDGLVIDGSIFFESVSRYNQSTINYMSGDNISVIEIVEPKESIHKRLLNFNKKVLSALPKPNNAFSFHTEIFHSKDNELVFCETASRAGGARIVESIYQSYGIHLEENTVKLQAGIWKKSSISIRNEPKILTAVILLPKRMGEVRKIPDEIPFKWVTEYQPRVKKGDILSSIGHSSDTIASLIVTGTTRKELWNNIEYVNNYLTKEIEIVEVNK